MYLGTWVVGTPPYILAIYTRYKISLYCKIYFAASNFFGISME